MQTVAAWGGWRVIPNDALRVKRECRFLIFCRVWKDLHHTECHALLSVFEDFEASNAECSPLSRTSVNSSIDSGSSIGSQGVHPPQISVHPLSKRKIRILVITIQSLRSKRERERVDYWQELCNTVNKIHSFIQDLEITYYVRRWC